MAYSEILLDTAVLKHAKGVFEATPLVSTKCHKFIIFQRQGNTWIKMSRVSKCYMLSRLGQKSITYIFYVLDQNILVKEDGFVYIHLSSSLTLSLFLTSLFLLFLSFSLSLLNILTSHLHSLNLTQTIFLYSISLSPLTDTRTFRVSLTLSFISFWHLDANLTQKRHFCADDPFNFDLTS